MTQTLFSVGLISIFRLILLMTQILLSVGLISIFRLILLMTQILLAAGLISIFRFILLMTQILLSNFYSLADLAHQLVKMAQMFTDDSDFALYWTDLNF